MEREKPISVHETLEGFQFLQKRFDRVLKEAPLTFPKFWDAMFHVPSQDYSVVLPALTNSLKDAVVYDFNDIDVSSAHREFMAKLFIHDQFPNFGEEVIVHTRTMYKSGDTPIMVLVSQSELGPIITPFARTHDNPPLVLPLFAASSFKFQIADAATGEITMALNSVAPLSHHEPLLPDGMKVGTQRYNNWCGSAVIHTLSLLGMLGCREVKRETIQASDKVNLRRAKSGKPKISDRIIISLNPVKREILGLNPSGHASPAPHWRRGHDRWFVRGQRLEKPILIPPTWVNWNVEDGTAEPQRKVYEVRK